MNEDSRVILSVITVVAYDLERLKISLKSYVGAPSNVQFVLVYPEADSKTETYVKKFLCENKLRITIIHDLGKGVYPAMNLGSKQTLGRYLMFWNAGDSCFSIENLNILIRDLDRSKPIWGFTQASFNWREPQALNTENVKNFVLQRGGYVSHQTLVARNSDFSYLGGFDESLKVAADYKLIAQLWQFGKVSFFDYEVVEVEFPNFSAQNNRVGRIENVKILFQAIPSKFVIISMFFILKRECNYLYRRICRLLLRNGEK
jgi:hypothetical protein